MNLSSRQKELLIKKLKFGTNSPSEARASVDYKKPFGYSIPIANFNGKKCSNFEIPNPGPHQIQVEARAISLNFRDLMIGLGLYLKIDGIPSCMGGDYAGVVVACGERVKDFKVGDEVIAIYGGSSLEDLHFCSVINVFEMQAVRKPRLLNFQEACCIPTVFTTAYYGLHRMAGISKNELVLIHTASGGLGLAAIQVAKWKHAIIYGTAGTENKRAYLKTLGVQQVMNSRSLEFYDLMLKYTNGDGVDVVLNTLSGQGLDKGMQLLKALGRFVHVDKTDISQKRQINLDLFRKATSFIFVDISQFYMNYLIKVVLEEIVDLFDQKIFVPIPFNAFPYGHVDRALNTMALASHIGKLVLDFSTEGNRAMQSKNEI